MNGFGKLREDGYLMSSTAKIDDSFEDLSIFEQDDNLQFYEYYKLEKVGNRYVPDFEMIKNQKKLHTQLEEEQTLKRKVLFKTDFPLGLTQVASDNTMSYICPRCRNNELTPNNVFGSDILRDMYCLRNDINCIQCDSNSMLIDQIDSLRILINSISINAFNHVYQMLGSQVSIGTISMKENQINDVYLEEMGVPKNAKILDVNLTSSCHLLPLKLMSNNTRYVLDLHESILRFFPANVLEIEKTIKDNNLSLYVQWMNADNTDIVESNLLNAMDNYIDNQPFELIMNANRTLELVCGQICFKEFVKENSSSRGKKRVEDFLVSGATYSHQLNHLLNLVCKANDLMLINKDLIQKIDWLRKLRNDIAHRGQLADNRKLSMNEKNEILAIAIFGSSLMKYINERI